MNDHKKIPIAMPWLGEDEFKATGRPIISGWVTQGPEVAAFEEEFAAYVGADHACAVSNCTGALHLALLAVGVKDGDEVITASHSFIATANSIRYCGARPVFIDIGPGTYNIDPLMIERAITDRTKAIICVHQMGMPCDLEAILKIAHSNDLFVIEDAACAIGSEILVREVWEKIGKPHGDIACFSFHPRKVITTGDGGMMTTSNPDWDKKFRLLRQHGMSVPDTIRHSSTRIIFESYACLGYNYRMTDIQAAVGREQLKKLDQILERRRFLGRRYQQTLPYIKELRIPEEPSWARSNWQSYCVILPDKCEQRQVMEFMLDRGIATRRGIMCSHREPAYNNIPLTDPLKESERAQDRGLLLPLYYQMSEEDQDYVIESLEDACHL